MGPASVFGTSLGVPVPDYPGRAEGLPNKEVAARVGVSQPAVGKWQSRFLVLRLDGLTVIRVRVGCHRSPRNRWKRSWSTPNTLVFTPKNATHWSRRSMAEKSGLSASTIGRIWHAFDLKPHRTDGFKLSNDPMFVEKVYDIVGLYLDRPEAAVVLCVDHPENHRSATVCRTADRYRGGRFPCQPPDGGRTVRATRDLPAGQHRLLVGRAAGRSPPDRSVPDRQRAGRPP